MLLLALSLFTHEEGVIAFLFANFGYGTNGMFF